MYTSKKGHVARSAITQLSAPTKSTFSFRFIRAPYRRRKPRRCYENDNKAEDKTRERKGTGGEKREGLAGLGNPPGKEWPSLSLPNFVSFLERVSLLVSVQTSSIDRRRPCASVRGTSPASATNLHKMNSKRFHSRVVVLGLDALASRLPLDVFSFLGVVFLLTRTRMMRCCLCSSFYFSSVL